MSRPASSPRSTTLRVLWIATKVPWPPVDGGRLLLRNTLRALRELGEHGETDVRVTLLAPTAGRPRREIEAAERVLADFCRCVFVQARLRPRWADGILSFLRRRPWTLERHRSAAVRRRAAELLHAARRDGEPFDLVQVEQVQALAQVPPTDLPVVLRAQNVESDLWHALGCRAGTPMLLRPWLRREARLLARAEAAAVRRADLTVALTEEDAGRLGELASAAGSGDTGDPATRIEVCRAPFAGELPAGDPLDGDPAVVLFGSAGWAPNADGARFFLRRVWPEVAERSGGAVLHVFGSLGTPGEEPSAAAGGRIRRHPPPEESAEALARGAVLVVPLFVASGVRMKILEAWARGVPVVATPVAARGLDATPGEELLVADEPAELAARIAEAGDGEVRRALVDGGRGLLARRHAPERVGRRLVELWSSVTSTAP